MDYNHYDFVIALPILRTSNIIKAMGSFVECKKIPSYQDGPCSLQVHVEFTMKTTEHIRCRNMVDKDSRSASN